MILLKPKAAYKIHLDLLYIKQYNKCMDFGEF